ncbi:MAG: hypothetical protein LC664_01140 [Flavobacteriales bacterium]|nr:hypothetical protein [Flavobacteriales bacterium]
MNTREFDKHFREKLGEYNSPVDTDAIWAGVQSRMDSDRSRAGFYWWFGSLLMLFILIGSAWYAVTDAGNSNALKTYTPRYSEVSLPLSELNSREENSAEEIGDNQNTHSNFGHQEEFPTNKARGDGEVGKAHQGNSSFDEETVSDSRNSEDVQLAGSSSELFTRNEITSKEYGAGNFKDSQAAQGGFDDGVAVIDEIPISGDLMTPIPASQFDWESRAVDLLENPENDLYPSDNSNRPEISLLVDGGAGFVGRQIESADPGWNAFTRQRLRTETPLEFANAQFRVSLELQNNWYFTAGASFTRINERFELDRITHEEELVTYVSDIHIGESGDSTLIYSTGLVSTEHHEQVNHINRYTFIDIPVTAGYNYDLGRWSLALEAGVLFNVRLRSTGSMLDSEGVVVRIENTNMFHSRLGLSYTGSVRIGYQSGTRTMLYIQPGVRYMPGSLTERGIQKQTYALYGINAGISYRLR